MSTRKLPEYLIFDRQTGERLHADRQFSATSKADMESSYEHSYGVAVKAVRAK